MKMLKKTITKRCSIALAILMGITLLMAPSMDVNALQSGVEMTDEEQRKDEQNEVNTENENKEDENKDENTVLEDTEGTLETVDIQEEDTAKIACARKSKYKFMWLYLIPGPSAVIFLVFFFKEKIRSKSNKNDVKY